MAGKRERREPGPAGSRCVQILNGGSRCKNRAGDSICTYCGKPVCAIHLAAHLDQEVRLIAWRNAAAGRATPELHPVP